MEFRIIYSGWVEGYSETGTLSELSLVNVQVWDHLGETIDVPLLYLSRQNSDFHVEFPYKPEKDNPHAKA